MIYSNFNFKYISVLYRFYNDNKLQLGQYTVNIIIIIEFVIINIINSYYTWILYEYIFILHNMNS